ncbi:MAG: hypothetical protein ABI981_03570 [Betaproteobacteria bacterium]
MLGLPLGEPLIPPHPDNNETGFWELASAVAINRRIFELIGLEWDSPNDLPSSWLERIPQAMFDEATATIEENFAGVPAFALKDPRICRLWPFWLRICSAAGVRVVAAHLVRAPAEVTASLTARDRISPERCAALWISHTLEAEAIPVERIVLRYDRLLDDSSATSRRLLEWLSAMGVSAKPADEAISRFLQPAQRHHRDLPPMTGAIGSLAEQLFHTLSQASEGSVQGDRSGSARDELVRERLESWLRSRMRFAARHRSHVATDAPTTWGFLRRVLFNSGLYIPPIRHIAHHQLEALAVNEYQATDVDPWFTLAPDDLAVPWAWPKGWYSVTLNGVCGLDQLSPKLYIDYGAGFSEATSIQLSVDVAFGGKAYFRAPESIAQIRLDPADRLLRFRFDSIEIRRVPAFAVAARIVAALASRRRSAAGLGSLEARHLRERWRLDGLAGMLVALERDIDASGRDYGWKPIPGPPR